MDYQKIILENKYEFLKLTFFDKTSLYLRHIINSTVSFVIPLILVVGSILLYFGLPVSKCGETNILAIPFLLFCASWFTPIIGKTLWHLVADGLLSFRPLLTFGLMMAMSRLSRAWNVRAHEK